MVAEDHVGAEVAVPPVAVQQVVVDWHAKVACSPTSLLLVSLNPLDVNIVYCHRWRRCKHLVVLAEVEVVPRLVLCTE